MALLFMDGFDAADYLIKWSPGTGTYGSSTSTNFSVGRSVYMYAAGGYLKKVFAPVSQVFVGFAMFQDASPTPNQAFLTILGDNSATSHLTVQFTNTTTLTVARGGTTLASATVTQRTAWGNYFEVSASIDDTVGQCIVRVNGVTVINFTGDTKNGGTNTTIDAVAIGDYGAYNQVCYFDDLYLCDSTGSAPYNTFLGKVRISTLSPNGAGSSTQFTPSSGANYTTVDELPYSTTDYVQDTTSGHRDTYTFSDVGSTTTIFGVQNSIIAKKTDVSSISLKPAVKSGATVYYGTTTALTTADSIIRNIHIVDPNTSAAWTQSGVNALEAGFEVA